LLILDIECGVKRARHLMLYVLLGSALAYPIKPDAKTLLKAFDRQDNDFPPARVGWQQKVPAPMNPVFESLRYPYTREAMAAQMTGWATPDLRLFGLFGLLIFTLRYYRERRMRTAALPAPVVTIRPENPAETRLAA
jgi:hypothetical protein